MVEPKDREDAGNAAVDVGLQLQDIAMGVAQIAAQAGLSNCDDHLLIAMIDQEAASLRIQAERLEKEAARLRRFQAC